VAANHKVGHYLAWGWLRNNWVAIGSYFDTAISSSVGKMIKSCAAGFNSPLELKELVPISDQKSFRITKFSDKFLIGQSYHQKTLTAWSSGIVSSCHLGDWSLGVASSNPGKGIGR
jgi:hypothetical protein